MRAARWIGMAGEIRETPARLCVWCRVPHWITPEDRVRDMAGAPTSHGMCDAAAAAMEKGLEETYGNGEAVA